MSSLATFSLGCFWGPDEFFSKIPGVLKTTVGYTGGKKENPNYEDLGDHTESLQIEFDPSILSYDRLLGLFWREHDPTYKAKTQYKSAIFTHDKEQYSHAIRSLEEQQKFSKAPIVTEIHPAETFYKAEEYHQKFLQKNRGAVC